MKGAPLYAAVYYVSTVVVGVMLAVAIVLLVPIDHTVLFLVAVIGLLLAAVACGRLSGWHGKEAAYWWNVAVMIEALPHLDEHFGPLLALTHLQPTPLHRRLGRWRPPHERYGIELPYGAAVMSTQR